MERQNEKYAKTITIFDKIEQSNGSLEFIQTLRNDDFPGLTTTIHGLVNVCRKHGDFKLAMVYTTVTFVVSKFHSNFFIRTSNVIRSCRNSQQRITHWQL